MDVTQPHRILIVDDEHNIRVVLRAALESASYLVEQAPDGAGALQRIGTGGIDLMVLDLNMPVLDGMTVLQQLHDQELSKPRVIVFTAHGSIAAAVKAVRLGASDFLEKPISPADFLLSVSSVLKEPAPPPGPPDADLATTSDLLRAVRREIAQKDLKQAERLLNDIAKTAAADPAYFNLLGVIHEAEGDRRAARTFYRKAVTLAGGYEPAKQNLHRLQELETYGRTRMDVKLGDEDELLGGLGSAVGAGKIEQLRRFMET